MHFFRSKTSIGLDIQPDEIRLLQLRSAGKQLSATAAAVMPLPEGAVIEGQIQQPDTVRQCLKHLIQHTQTAGKTVTIALPAQCVISKKIQLSADLEAAALVAEIDDNLSNYFPGTQGLAYDYAPLNTDTILLVAARDEQLIATVNVVEQAGLKVKCMDVDVYALTHAVEFSIDQCNRSQLIAFVDMNDPVAQLIIAYHNEILFHRQLRNKTIPEICSQIQFGLQFCYNHCVKIDIQKIYLSGSAAILSTAIESQLSIPTEYINPFEKMSYPPELATHFEKMLLCCGLALRRGALD